MEKALSICIAVYNIKEKLLRECIESVIYDKSRDTEIIIGDDCSDERCGRICMEYASMDDRIIYVRPEKNGGVSRLRNLMLDMASGDVITFVDGDDAVSRGYTASARAAAFSGYDIVMIQWREFSGSVPLSDAGTVNILSVEQKAAEEFSLSCITGAPSGAEKYGIEKCTPSSVCTKIYKRDFLLKNNIRFKENLKKSQDVVFNTEAFFKCKSLGYMPRLMYFYRQNPDSVCHRYSADFENTVYDCIKYDTENIKSFFPNNTECIRLWSKYKLIFYIISNFELNIFHRKNKKSIFARRKDFEAFISREPFKTFFESFDFDSYNWEERKLVLKLAKKRCFAGLNFLYRHPIGFKIYGWTKNRLTTGNCL